MLLKERRVSDCEPKIVSTVDSAAFIQAAKSPVHGIRSAKNYCLIC